MAIFSDLTTSTDLVGGLVLHLGVELDRPMMRDPERAAPDYRSMMPRCRTRTDQTDCADRRARSAHFDAAPGYCRYKGIFDQAR